MVCRDITGNGAGYVSSSVWGTAPPPHRSQIQSGAIDVFPSAKPLTSIVFFQHSEGLSLGWPKYPLSTPRDSNPGKTYLLLFKANLKTCNFLKTYLCDCFGFLMALLQKTSGSHVRIILQICPTN